MSENAYHARARVGACRTYRDGPLFRWGATGRGLRAAHRASTILLWFCCFWIGSVSKVAESCEIVIIIVIIGFQVPGACPLR